MPTPNDLQQHTPRYLQVPENTVAKDTADKLGYALMCVAKAAKAPFMGHDAPNPAYVEYWESHAVKAVSDLYAHLGGPGVYSGLV